MKIAKEGLLFIAPALLLAVLFALPGWWPAAAFFALLTAAFVFFFRDPARRPPAGEHLVVSPADGKVVRIDTFPSHPDIPGPVTRVCIFLSLYDVHLTRAPLSADVRRVDYHPGKFFPAYRDEASEPQREQRHPPRGRPDAPFREADRRRRRAPDQVLRSGGRPDRPRTEDRPHVFRFPGGDHVPAGGHDKGRRRR